MTDATKLGYLATLRRLERDAADKPPIGRNRTLKEEIVALGQDPFLAFPGSDASNFERPANGKPRLRLQLLGLFGPQGPLPLTTTEDVRRWFDMGDDAFVAFADIFAARFQELFFRAWSDTHAISQFDHPSQDRFQDYIAAIAGIGTPAFHGHSHLPDTFKLPLVAHAGNRIKSPVRLRQMIEHLFHTPVDVNEHLLGWMDFEPDAYSRIGQQGATLGQDCIMGSRIPSVSETIGLHFRFSTLAQYRRFLPGGPDHATLCDLIFWYLGKRFDIRVTLALLASQIPPAKLGETVELGYMACIAPPDPGEADDFIDSTTFVLDPETLPAAA
ncbi:type VI secretion system baseplate subunit TssG [Aestuariibius sp. 2305UL40-4]|uniref:type VI secretion system baseplate subunit TssG n=1 Tax=Aestuariibius violaceus TaxID=3234132 RepID=UPI00345E2473